MGRARVLSWFMLAVWASWITAAQGVLASPAHLGAWCPDLGLLLLISCVSRFHAADVPKATAVLAIARIAYSVEPPAAIFAGFIAVAFLVRDLRGVAELGQIAIRIVVAGLLSWGFSAWLVLVHAARNTLATASSASPGTLAFESWRGAVATAFMALFLGAGLELLPGLSPLRKRRW
jgi:hypothetical protein